MCIGNSKIHVTCYIMIFALMQCPGTELSVAPRYVSLSLSLYVYICTCIHTHIYAKVNIHSHVFFLNWFFWGIVTLQCCFSFCSAAKWISYIHLYPFFFGFHSNLSHHRELSSITCCIYSSITCCIVGSH